MRTTIGIVARMAVVAAALTGALACATTGAPDGPWMTHYVGSPDDVWIAIHIALAELEYEVESESRQDGTVSALRAAADGAPATAIAVDQVMRNDEVKVFVTTAAAAGGPELDRDERERLATAFLAEVNRVLYK
jgi:hypothetical protein